MKRFVNGYIASLWRQKKNSFPDEPCKGLKGLCRTQEECTVNTGVLAAPFCSKFSDQIGDAAYLEDHLVFSLYRPVQQINNNFIKLYALTIAFASLKEPFLIEPTQ